MPGVIVRSILQAALTWAMTDIATIVTEVFLLRVRCGGTLRCAHNLLDRHNERTRVINFVIATGQDEAIGLH